jgi:hypothetical protein
MSEYITINLTQPKEEIKFSYTEQNEEIVFSFSEAARGAQGEPGAAATVDQTIIDGSSNAVSGNAVFDGLALKAPIANPTFTGIVTAPRITGRCDGIEVLCKAGLAINAGQVVYITGASGNNIIIGLAQANTEPTSSKTIGISESTLAHNATGYAITEGLMTVSISAPSAIEGDPIWLSSSTAGGMVFGLANKPSAPNHIVYLGVVTRKSGNTVVEIYVKIQNGAELDELADVAITSATAGQALMRGATTWENRSLVSSDISDATNLAIANTVVKRSNLGNVSFSKTTGAGATLGVIGAGAQGITSDVTTGTAGLFTATSGTAFRGYSSTGTDHAQFGEITGDNRSFIRRVLGLFGWNRGSFVQTLGSPATLTADSAIELPDIASGTIALTSDSRFTDERVPTAAGLTSKFGTNKATIANGDKFTILDSAASDAPKHTLWSLIVSTLTTAFNALYVGLTGNQTIAGNKTFSGQTELTGQAATNSTSAMTRGLVESAKKLRTNEKIYGCYSVTASGGGSSAGANTYGLGFAQLIAGTATSSYAFGYYALEPTNNGFGSGAGTNFGANWELTGSFRHSASDNHEGVFRLGVAVLSNATNLANANAFSSIGIGFEFGRVSTNINQARIIYHDGSTYKTSAWVTVYTGDPVQREFAYRLHNNGSGTITLYMTITGSNNAGSPSMLNIASLVSVTDGPTGVSANSSGIYWSAVNSSATYTIGLGRLSPSPILMTF